MGPRRELFLFGHGSALVKDMLTRGFRKNDRIEFGARDGNGYLRVNGREEAFAGAAASAHAFMQESFIGLISDGVAIRLSCGGCDEIRVCTRRAGMSAAGELPASPQAAHDARFDCLEAPRRAGRRGCARTRRSPQAGGDPAVASQRAWRALGAAHVPDRRGSDRVRVARGLTGQPPDWLAPRIEQHLADERRHAAAFADAARARRRAVGCTARFRLVEPAQDHAMAPACAAPCAAFRKACSCRPGATGLCAEQMAMRVLARHCATIGDAHPLYPLLARARRRDAACPALLGHAAPSGCAVRGSASRRVAERDPRDRGRFRRDGALAMVAAGWFQSLRPRA